MNLSRSVFIPKYPNKKLSVSGLFLTIILICAFVLVSALMVMVSEPHENESDSLLILSLVAGFTILLMGGVILWPAKEAGEPLALMHSTDLSKELNDLKNEKKYFSSILSHDLRSPLSSIVLLASYLRSKEDLTDTSHYIELIEQSARKELEMMTSLLSLMRADSFNSGILEPVNIKSGVEAAVQGLAVHHPDKHLNLNVRIDPDLSVATDPMVVMITLKSLLNQALHFSDPEQSVEVRAEEESDFVTIYIEVKSSGLNDEAAKKLFHSDRLSEQHEGKSFPDIIDLYFCRKIVSAYNGTIHVQEEANGQIHFILSLDRRLSTKIA